MTVNISVLCEISAFERSLM